MTIYYQGSDGQVHGLGGDRVLSHHGVLGMKWGVRRYQPYSQVPRKSGKSGKEQGAANKWKHGRADSKKRRYSYAKQGGTIEKGSKALRLTIEEKDPTYANKKHVSITKKDNRKWKQYLVAPYERSGRSVYEKEYEFVKDVKVASETESGKIFYEKFMASDKASIQMKTITDSYESLNRVPAYRGTKLARQFNEKNASLAASVNIAFQTETGKAFIDELLKQGYGAVSDTHGRNTARDPLIILNPDKSVKEIKSKKISRR